MNVQIVEQRENSLLSRKEIRARLLYDQATPSKEQLKKQLAAAMKVEPQLLVVKSIYPAYGERRANILVYQYKSEEMLKKIEPEQKVKKEKSEKAAEAAEKPQAAAKKPGEEKKAQDGKEEKT